MTGCSRVSDGGLLAAALCVWRSSAPSCTTRSTCPRSASAISPIGCCPALRFGVGLYGATYQLAAVSLAWCARLRRAAGRQDHDGHRCAASSPSAPLADYADNAAPTRGCSIAAGYRAAGRSVWLGNGFAMTLCDRFLGPVLAAGWRVVRRSCCCLLRRAPHWRSAALRPSMCRMQAGIFNLMRNLGGAIGLAGIDTVLEQRTPAHAASSRRPPPGRGPRRPPALSDCRPSALPARRSARSYQATRDTRGSRSSERAGLSRRLQRPAVDRRYDPAVGAAGAVIARLPRRLEPAAAMPISSASDAVGTGSAK